jgi:hypothetical protein
MQALALSRRFKYLQVYSGNTTGISLKEAAKMQRIRQIAYRVPNNSY